MSPDSTATIDHAEGAFPGHGDLPLYYQRWRPREQPPRAAVALVHGFGEHSGRYATVVDHLVPRGYALYALDHRGHGRSPGPRGHIRSWAEFRSDVRALVRLVGEREPGLPLFLFGHSMGGLVVLEYALHHPEGLRGVAASAPALSPPGVSRALRALSRAASRVWPSFSLDIGGDPAVLSRDPAVLEALAADPLAHGRASARLGTEMARAASWTQAHAAEWRLPLLLVHGLADRLTSPGATRSFYDRVPTPDKQLILYDGGRHESHNDLHRDQAVADLARWLDRHLAGGTGS